MPDPLTQTEGVANLPDLCVPVLSLYKSSAAEMQIESSSTCSVHRSLPPVAVRVGGEANAPDLIARSRGEA